MQNRKKKKKAFWFDNSVDYCIAYANALGS